MDSPEQRKIIPGLETAIRMEIDGKAFYLKACADSTNEGGKHLFSQLASEENVHRRLFEQIYEAIRKQNSWPQVEITNASREKALFSRGESGTAVPEKALSNEIDAVKQAIDMEIRSHDFYKAQMNSVNYSSEKLFYQRLAAEEQGHQLALVDYLEFLQAPSSYFSKKEHSSLDGV
jgi:rubrerythrin